VLHFIQCVFGVADVRVLSVVRVVDSATEPVLLLNALATLDFVGHRHCSCFFVLCHFYADLGPEVFRFVLQDIRCGYRALLIGSLSSVARASPLEQCKSTWVSLGTRPNRICRLIIQQMSSLLSVEPLLVETTNALALLGKHLLLR